MSRWVVPQGSSRGLVQSASDVGDNWIGRIVKYVPSEVVATFTMIMTVFASISASPGARIGVGFGLIVAGIIATIVYIMMKTEGPVKKAHLIVSPLAFAGWSYPISGTVLGDAFIPLVAFLIQAVVIILSIFIKPD